MDKYLFIGAHVDDLELSCGGTIAKILEQGHNVTCLTLSHIYSGVDLLDEWCASMNILNPSFVWVNNFEVRNFDKDRQAILEYLYQQKGYDYVFTHSPRDFHQDHRVVGEESIRAFKNTNLITYCAPWNQTAFRKNLIIKLKKDHIDLKLKSLSCYKSQVNKRYFKPGYIQSWALSEGIGDYAESFEIIHWYDT